MQHLAGVVVFDGRRPRTLPPPPEASHRTRRDPPLSVETLPPTTTTSVPEPSDDR